MPDEVKREQSKREQVKKEVLNENFNRKSPSEQEWGRDGIEPELRNASRYKKTK